MSTTSFFTATKRTIASLLVVVLIAPAALFSAPPKAHALFGAGDTVLEVGANLFTNLKNTIEATINTLSTISNTAANYAQMVNAYVLQPIAFVTSGNLIKSITAGVLKFVGGESNGTGQAQFVQNLRGHMQGVGDTQARSFFNQFSTLSNSPFAPGITSSLSRNYLQSTSLSGFFVKNQCTLDQSSSNITGFLQGNFKDGGWSAWFAVSTKQENNPYTLYANTQSTFSQIVTDATAARLAEINWGQGFLSWCGADSTLAAPSGGNGLATSPSTAATTNGQTSTQDSSVVASYTYDPNSGNAPGDACTNADGTPGTIKTPGSVIKDELAKATGLDWEKLTNMGNAGPEINNILQNIGTVMNTIGSASSLMSSGSGGLAGLGGSSQFADYQARAGYLGVTESSVAQTASSVVNSVDDAVKRVNDYADAWNTINASATTATTALTNLVTACQASNNFVKPGFAQTAAGYVTAAGVAQTSLVNPIFVDFAAASTTIATDRVLIAKINAEKTSAALGSGGAFGADSQTLQAAPPNLSDVVNTQVEARPALANDVQASPAGSLQVAGGTKFDRMTLITQNANTMAAACDAAKQQPTTP